MKKLMYSAGASQCEMLSSVALDDLFEATSDPQFVAVSFRLDCIQNGPYCSVSLAFYQHRARGCVD